MKGPNYIHCITGEINAVLGQMKLSTRYTSAQRFYKEIPMVSETPLMRTFKSLHERISLHSDLEGLDPMEYFEPFLDLVANPETPADLTFVALSSIDKFLLYGLVTKDTPDAIIVINNTADALCHCRFESTYSTTEESVYQYLLDIILTCVRCDAGVLLTKNRAWNLVSTVYDMAFCRSVTPLLQKSASNTLTHIILTLFSRLRNPENFDCVMPVQERTSLTHLQYSVRSTEIPSELASTEVTPEEEMSPCDTEVVVVEGADTTDEMTVSAEEESDDDESVKPDPLVPYSIALLHQVLAFLIGITNPSNTSLSSLRYGLSTINILLEMNGDVFVNYQPLIELLQGNFCKFLIQNSQSEDTAILSLSLRVIFNLFQGLKSFLKVQLEVFFTSVHIRLADIEPVTPHDFLPKEASLESLLDFCQEPTVMTDLYMNYDCDTQCTNLYEHLCDCLYHNAIPEERKPLTSIHTLAAQGLLAILHSIAQKCTVKDPSCSEEHIVRSHSHLTILKRKQRKKVLHEFSQLFNEGYKKEAWIEYLIKEKMISGKEDYQAIAELLRESTEIDKTVLGEALSYSEDRNPFLAKLRISFIRTFSFTDMPIDMVLRSFLGTFRIPGEAQAIDRIMDDLSQYVYETNPGPFLSADALFALLFSCLLLNTDLHNPGVKNRMTFQDFCRNNSGINDGQDFPMDYLQYLYDSIKSEEIKLLSSSTEMLDLSRWEQDITYRANKVSEPAFVGLAEETASAGDCEQDMFLLMEAKAREAVELILLKSEDEQLLAKTLQGIEDYLHITHYFDLKNLFSSCLQYLCSVIPKLIILRVDDHQPSPGVSPSFTEETEENVKTWKCLHTIRLLFKMAIHYQTTIEEEWKNIISLLFWLDNHGLLPSSPTLLDIASPDNTIFPSLIGDAAEKPTEDHSLWTALSSLFAGEVNISIPVDLVDSIKEVITECNIEDLFTKSNRMKVNSWIILFKSLISTDHALAITKANQSRSRMISLYVLKLHWMVLLLSKNTDRIGMVWGLVNSFLERVRGTAVEMDYKYILERFIVETITLTNIILSKPQLSDQGLSLLLLLEPIPSHICLSSRRTAGIYYLLNSLYPYLTSPSKWNQIINLLSIDAGDDLGRNLVWQVLCRLLQEGKISLLNFVSVLKCSLKTIENYHEIAWGRQLIEFIFALTMYCSKLSSQPDSMTETLSSVDNIPTPDQCWYHCVAVLKSFADGTVNMGVEIAETAIDRLQRSILRQNNSIPSGGALYKCFDTIMFPLLVSYGSKEREKSYMVGVFVSTLLVSSEVLVKQPGFSSFWLRIVDVLCKFVSQGGSLGETTTERMKNLLLVMIVEKRFDAMNAICSQNILEATMTMLDSYCPSIRKELELALNPVAKEKVEKKEVIEETSFQSEEVKEERLNESEERTESQTPQPEEATELQPEQSEMAESQQEKSEEVPAEADHEESEVIPASEISASSVIPVEAEVMEKVCENEDSVIRVVDDNTTETIEQPCINSLV